MSFFKSIGNALGGIGRALAPVARAVLPAALNIIPGVGPILSRAATAVQAAQQYQSPRSPQYTPVSLIQNGYSQRIAASRGQSMSLLPQIVRGGQAAGGFIRRNAGSIAGGAITGGSIYAGMRGGGGGAPRRRASKGITGSQLKAFKRVTGILDKYCKIAPPTKKRNAPRSAAKCR